MIGLLDHAYALPAPRQAVPIDPGTTAPPTLDPTSPPTAIPTPANVNVSGPRGRAEFARTQSVGRPDRGGDEPRPRGAHHHRLADSASCANGAGRRDRSTFAAADCRADGAPTVPIVPGISLPPVLSPPLVR